MLKPLFAAAFTIASVNPVFARTAVVRGVTPQTGPSVVMPGLPVLSPAIKEGSRLVGPAFMASSLPSLQLPASLPVMKAADAPKRVQAAAPGRVVAGVPVAMPAGTPHYSNPSRVGIETIEAGRKLRSRIDNTPGLAANLLGGFFDGKKMAPASLPVMAADPAAVSAAVSEPPGRGWREGILSSNDGTSLVYHRRGPSSSNAPRIFVGGLALAQSFDVHFEMGPAPERLEYRLNLRGLAPSGWSPTKEVIDADARDLARMILTAAGEAGSSQVELALHSYAAVVLQRMIQLEGEPEVAAALGLLRGARVTMFGPTTHVPGSEALMGPEMEMLAAGLRQFVGVIDQGDAVVDYWNAMARLNPLAIPYAAATEAAWKIQRQAAIALAVGDIERMLKQDLSAPWPDEIEPLRQRMLAEVDIAARTPQWQEAALRRVRDGFDLNFDDASAARLQGLGARLRVVYSHDDALLPWKVQRLMLSKLGIDPPDAQPPVGTVLYGPNGIEVVIAAGDHYLPLMRYDALPGHLER